jgi:hypothetical protein
MPPWGCTLRGGDEDVFFHEASLQPLLQNDPVHGCVGQQPVVADPIEAAFDIALQDPGGAVVVAQDLVTLIQGIGTTAFLAKAVGVGIGQRFLDRVQAEEVQSLHGPVGQGGDAQRTQLGWVAAFRNVDAPQRLWLIAVATQSAESFRLQLRSVPDVAVHSGSGGTLIGGHA